MSTKLLVILLLIKLYARNDILNTVYHFVGSTLGVEIFLKKRERHKKDALKQKIEASLYTLYWGLEKIRFTLYTYVLAKILQNAAKFIQKLTPGFKNHMRNLDNFKARSGKSNKLKFNGLLLSKKYTLQLKYYIQRISLTLLSTTCVKIHRIPQGIFETISHFSRHNSSVFFQLKHYIQILHWKLSDFPHLVKIYQIPHVIFQTKSQFFFKVWITLQCHER